jgi:type IX secretion system PorP/SprF family membrane protein
MVGKRNWIGAGLMMYRDVAGNSTNHLTQQNVALSAAFHYALDKKYKNILTFGLKIGGSSFAFNADGKQLTYAGLSGGSDPEFSKNYPTRNFIDFSAGVMLKSKIDKKSNITFGIGLGHINSPRIALSTANATTGYRLPMAFTGHLEYSRDINKKVSIMPSLLFRTISGSKDGTIQAQVGYKLDPVRRPDLTLKGGLGYRFIGNFNNLCLLLGADYKNFRFGLGYDIPRADLATAVQNTLELSLHYTGKIYKKPVTKGAHFCPKY